MVTPLIWRQGEISPPVLALRTLLALVLKDSGRKGEKTRMKAGK
jgi:hypothetical protein